VEQGRLGLQGVDLFLIEPRGLHCRW